MTNQQEIEQALRSVYDDNVVSMFRQLAAHEWHNPRDAEFVGSTLTSFADIAVSLKKAKEPPPFVYPEFPFPDKIQITNKFPTEPAKMGLRYYVNASYEHLPEFFIFDFLKKVYAVSPMFGGVKTSLAEFSDKLTPLLQPIDQTQQDSLITNGYNYFILVRGQPVIWNNRIAGSLWSLPHFLLILSFLRDVSICVASNMTWATDEFQRGKLIRELDEYIGHNAFDLYRGLSFSVHSIDDDDQNPQISLRVGFQGSRSYFSYGEKYGWAGDLIQHVLDVQDTLYTTPVFFTDDHNKVPSLGELVREFYY